MICLEGKDYHEGSCGSSLSRKPRRSTCIRSDEETEAKPMKIEVVILAEFNIQFYTKN